MRKWLLLFLLSGGSVAFWLWRSSTGTNTNAPIAHSGNAQDPVSSPVRVASPGSIPETNVNVVIHPSEQPVVSAASSASPPPAVSVEPLAPELANVDPGTVLQNMRITVRQYGAMFGGNPVGTNPEITRALHGDNPRQIDFLKADGNRVNSQGELVDAWGTPYFFHQLSGTEMEIRSAGPDRVMYTQDDLVIK